MADGNPVFQPLSGNDTPRFAGTATFMRLPLLADPAGVDIALVGVPSDVGTTNRPGARHGPRALRDASTMIRAMNQITGIRPFELCNCADLGDASVNPVDVDDTLSRVTAFYETLVDHGVVPLTAGGDHLSTLPILRALCRERPAGLIQIDAHSDTWDTYFGKSRYTHGTPVRRAIEEGLLEPARIVQIGLRGPLFADQVSEWGRQQGVREMTIDEAYAMGLDAAIAEARRLVGTGPVYISFDIDSLDPVYAPGTGTPEVGGFTSREAQVMIRGLQGLNIIGADVVEVSPPFDSSGTTALVGATLMFELLCVLSHAVASRSAVSDR